MNWLKTAVEAELIFRLQQARKCYSVSLAEYRRFSTVDGFQAVLEAKREYAEVLRAFMEGSDWNLEVEKNAS
jgi:hypothetical protein